MGIKIGVDGGGSKTEIVAVNHAGRILTSLRKPSSNYHVVGIKEAVKHIIDGVREALLPNETIDGIGLSLAGIDTIEDWNILGDGLKTGFKLLSREAGFSFSNIPIVLENDSFGALMSIRGEFSGNVLAAGTGTVALGIAKSGEVIRVGGWGHLIGDYGSGYDIGRMALAGMVASYDGYGPKTILETMIPQYLGLKEIRDIGDWLYQENRTNKDVAALVPLVVEAVHSGDNFSKSILEKAGHSLGLLTLALLRKTEGLELGLTGGISNIWVELERAFNSAIKEELKGLQILKPKYSHSFGAALLSGIDNVRRIKF